MAHVNEPWHIVQLTDSHLFEDEQQRLQGMDTQASFHAVADAVRAERPRVDLILGTGDITQDRSAAAYRLFYDAAMALAPDMVWIPGNHDEAEVMKSLSFATDCNRRIIDNEHWRIIMLDSSVPGKVHGELSAGELVFLEEALVSAGNRHVLVSLHHNPIPSECAWLDQHKLRNSQAFHDVLAPCEQLKVVLWGHIHQHVEKVIDGVHYLATPSTCVQFAPQQTEFKLDDKPPGYRWLDLYPDGHVETDISRVDVELYVDLGGNGY